MNEAGNRMNKGVERNRRGRHVVEKNAWAGKVIVKEVSR